MPKWPLQSTMKQDFSSQKPKHMFKRVTQEADIGGQNGRSNKPEWDKLPVCGAAKLMLL